MVLLVVPAACLVDLGPERALEDTESEWSERGGVEGTASTSSGQGGSAVLIDPPLPVKGTCNGEKVVWAIQLSGTHREYSRSIAPDGQGGVFLSGAFDGTINLGGDDLVSHGSTDIFLARFNDQGEHVWSRAFGDSAEQGVLKLYPAPNGGLVAAGDFKGTVDFGGPEPLTADGDDGVVLRYDVAGNLLWQKQLGGPEFQGVRKAVVDPVLGDVYLGGVFHVRIDFGDVVTVSEGLADPFIAKLNADGDYVWSRHMPGPAKDYTFDVALDGEGHLLAGGSADGDIDLGEGVQLSFGDGQADAWVGLYDAETGAPIWTRLWPAPGYQAVRRVERNAFGEPVIAGRFLSHLALDTTSSDRDQATFVAQLDASGYETSATVIGSAFEVSGLERKMDGQFLVSGYFTGALDTDSDPIFTKGKDDGMIIQLDLALAPVGTIVVGSTDADDVSSLALGSGTHPFATTNFRNTASVSDCEDFTSFGDTDMLLMKLAPF